MAKDSFLSSVVDFIKRPKVPFSGGLSHTDNDALIGQAADMQNMIIENGIAVKRRGSICLNKCDEVQDYYLLETITVAGSEFIIGVDSSRNLIAFFKDFPEKPMYICRSHFSRTTAVSFTKGVRFFKISTPFGWTILNEFGEAYSIKSDGILKIGKNNNHPAYYPLSEIDRDDGNDYLLYLDVFEATNEETEVFFMENDGLNDTIPVQGDVRVATINEAGVISKFSPATAVAEKECKLFGLNPFNTYRLKAEEKVGDYRKFEILNYSLEDDSFVTANDEQRVLLEEERTIGTAFNDNFNSTQSGINVTSALAEESSTLRCIVIKNNDGEIDGKFKLIPINIGGQTNAVQMESIFDATGLTELHGRYKMERVGRLKMYGEYDTPPTTGDVYVEADDAYLSLDEDDADNYRMRGFHFVGFLTNYTDEQLADDSLVYDSTEDSFVVTSDLLETKCGCYSGIVAAIIGGDGKLTRFDNLKLANFDLVDIHYTTSTDKLTKAFPVIEAFTDITDMDYSLTHKGFDCWDTQTVTARSASLVSFDDSVIDYSQLAFRALKGNILFIGSVFLDDLYTNKQFAVWSDGYIISKSQRVFTDSSDEIVYGLDDEQSASYLNYDGSITGRNISQIKESVSEKFLAITKPVYQTLRRQAYKYNPFTEILKDVDDVASNSGKLCAIRSNRLWFGSSVTLLLDNQVSLNGKLYAVNSLGEYFVVFTSEGSFVMSPDGKKQAVYNSSTTNPSIIKTHTGLKAVYGINMLGEIIMLTQREVSKNNFAFVVDVISNNIHSVKFSSQTTMKEISDILYVADGDTVYAYRDGVWSEKMFFEGKTVRHMTNLDDKLVVFFNDNFDVEDADISSGTVTETS